jgi:hypothetical protein
MVRGSGAEIEVNGQTFKVVHRGVGIPIKSKESDPVGYTREEIDTASRNGLDLTRFEDRKKFDIKFGPSAPRLEPKVPVVESNATPLKEDPGYVLPPELQTQKGESLYVQLAHQGQASGAVNGGSFRDESKP